MVYCNYGYSPLGQYAANVFYDDVDVSSGTFDWEAHTGVHLIALLLHKYAFLVYNREPGWGSGIHYTFKI